MRNGVLPKLNWSAPKDATWLNEATLRCRTPGDIYLLLKSSDFCTHDVLYQAIIEQCSDYDPPTTANHTTTNPDSTTTTTTTTTTETDFAFPPLQLVLRKWCALHPSQEFRCFIRRSHLVAVSQRHHSVYYPHLSISTADDDDNGDDDCYVDRVREILHEFCATYIYAHFAQGTIPNYVVDLYVDKDDQVWIVDFNPWSAHTDALLYDWEELIAREDEDDEDDATTHHDVVLAELRVAESEQAVRPDPLANYRAPIDTVDLATMTQGDSQHFTDFMNLCGHQQHLT